MRNCRGEKTFSAYASELNRLMKYTDRDDIGRNVRKEYEAVAAIYAEIKKNASILILLT